MLQNIDLIGRHFPEWKVYLYTSPDVDAEFLQQVVQYSNVLLRPTGKFGIVNMVERFFAIDEPDVEIMFVRDADSHVHWKDRWAIRSFLSKPHFLAHAIRDHPEHTSSLMGGLWGIRKSAKLNISKQYERFMKDPIDRGYGIDQSFLSTYVYPYIRSALLVHVGEGPAYEREHFIKFPFLFSKTFFCGRDDGSDFVDVPEPTRRAVFSFLKSSP
jgi:hypothetical protein